MSIDANDNFDIDRIIAKCKDGGDDITEKEFMDLMFKLLEIISNESNLLELESPVIIIGDIHGQLYDLFELFKTVGEPGEEGTPGHKYKFLFMGDYVDRGSFSIPTFAYLAAFKVKYRDQVFLLRGNHECRQVNQMYGFYAECSNHFGHSGPWSLCNEAFDFLPMAAVTDRRVFSVHGGLSPDIPTIEKINSYERDKEIPSKGAFSDLTWSDPDNVEMWKENTRGAGYLFGKKQTCEFLALNNLEFVTRSHQVAQEGHQWHFNKALVTIWSAPNYMYRTGNKATVMLYDGQQNQGKDYRGELVYFKECPDDKRKAPEDIGAHQYFL